MQWLVSRFILSPVDIQRCSVHRDLYTRWPIGVHCPVFVVETFELQFQIVSVIEQNENHSKIESKVFKMKVLSSFKLPPHDGLMDGGFQLEYVIANG